MTGAKYLNTMSNGAVCTVGFSAIWAVLSWVCSLPRTFDTLSKLATLSAFFTFPFRPSGGNLCWYSSHIQRRFQYTRRRTNRTFVTGNPIVLVIPAAGTTFVSGMNAFLNISYTFIGQITIPSFIAEMKKPKDFPKALWAVTIAEIIVFSLVGAIVYVYTGSQYNVSPAFGSLGNELYKKVSFSFMIPTLIFLGCPLRLRLGPFHLLPHFRGLPATRATTLFSAGLCGLGSWPLAGSCRLHHRRGHSVLLGLALVDELALRFVLWLHLLGYCLLPDAKGRLRRGMDYPQGYPRNGWLHPERDHSLDRLLHADCWYLRKSSEHRCEVFEC